MADLLNIAISKQVNYMHNRGKTISIDFHLHDGFEIYFLVSGDVNYFVEKKVYPLKYGDLIITNSFEVHTPSFRSGKTYERIILQFHADIPEKFSSPQFNLLDCFINRPLGTRNRISLDKSRLTELLALFQKIETADGSGSAENEILKVTYFIQLLVFINKAYADGKQEEDYANVPEKLLPVLDYIDDNLDSELSLGHFENRFYINRFYLSRLFKESTGINIHEYITFKRISKAKQLLASGLSVTDTCLATGFPDYSNFIRVFKRITGTPPGKYKKNLGRETVNYEHTIHAIHEHQ